VIPLRKKFKARKRKNYFKYIILLFIILGIYFILQMSFLKIKLTSSNEEFLKKLLEDSNHHLAYESNTNISKILLDQIYNMNLEDPVTILASVFGYEKEKTMTVVSSSDAEVEEVKTNYISDPKQEEVEEPLVYIYNTHQTENYSYTKYEEYNITPNVMMASYVLREKLNNVGIETIVETTNIKELLNLNSWSYANSYKASRLLVQDTLEKYPSLKLIIDLHRDSLKKESSTVTINNKKYAKILFVIGKEYQTYEKNYNVATKLNEIIKKTYPTLTRGIILKEGNNVNGIYNQDLKENIILIECGGNENSLDEVLNTIEVLKDTIVSYLGVSYEG
jgi:stage II sporulation protein P